MPAKGGPARGPCREPRRSRFFVVVGCPILGPARVRRAAGIRTDDRSASVEYVDERPGQVDRHIGSVDKMERLTGWRARTSFAEGLERTVAWYRENEVWWRELLQRAERVSSS